MAHVGCSDRHVRPLEVAAGAGGEPEAPVLDKLVTEIRLRFALENTNNRTDELQATIDDLAARPNRIALDR